jgi:hypothetical protein
VGVEVLSVGLLAVGGTANEGVVADSFGFSVVEGTVALGVEGFSVHLLVVGGTSTERLVADSFGLRVLGVNVVLIDGFG